MAYRLRADVLRKAAAAHGDKSVRRIIAHSGLPRSVIQRNLGGYTEPSLGTLMRLASCYGVTVEDLVEEIEEEPTAVAS
jgi:transcriptional regulator with XRE-family HTH domain